MDGATNLAFISVADSRSSVMLLCLLILNDHFHFLHSFQRSRWGLGCKCHDPRDSSFSFIRVAWQRESLHSPGVKQNISIVLLNWVMSSVFKHLCSSWLAVWSRIACGVYWTLKWGGFCHYHHHRDSITKKEPPLGTIWRLHVCGRLNINFQHLENLRDFTLKSPFLELSLSGAILHQWIPSFTNYRE